MDHRAWRYSYVLWTAPFIAYYGLGALVDGAARVERLNHLHAMGRQPIPISTALTKSVNLTADCIKRIIAAIRSRF